MNGTGSSGPSTSRDTVTETTRHLQSSNASRRVILILPLPYTTSHSSNMSIMDHNGGSVIAMVGKECVAIASDLRWAIRLWESRQISKGIFPVTDHIYFGLPGLATESIRYETVSVSESTCTPSKRSGDRPRNIRPPCIFHLIRTSIRPYFIEPVMAGLTKTPTGGYKPFIAATDLIGCLNFAKDFVVAGTASTKLYGVAEGLWEPDLEPEDLFETISQTLMNAVDRDAFSGWGCIVHVITKDKVVTRTLKGRMD
ncbi:20S proteasome subunit beta 3 [Pholiota molesta]|nr:20S proteasome subunit beta 3 [Pholiota molesta]